MPFAQVSGHIEFHEIEAGTLDLGSLHVTTEPVTHPGPTFAYRLEENGRSFAFVPDHEPALTEGLRGGSLEAIPGSAIARSADVLFHDAQYTAEEYATRVGWGHSSLPDFAAFTRLAEPSRVVMFHHDPAHTDEELESMLAEAATLLDGSGPHVELALRGDGDRARLAVRRARSPGTPRSRRGQVAAGPLPPLSLGGCLLGSAA